MPTIYVENVPYEVSPGQNLLAACLSLGFDLPYFCWHPAMGSVGACRQCAVKQFKDENDRYGKIVMACLTPAEDGTRISIADPEAWAFRNGIIQWLMANHPHDCPVCDEGGECHLQDMTVMTGHVRRRYAYRKRTFRNQDLGPFVAHEMNRCIQCYRCVRFYSDYAGGRDLVAQGIRNHVYFGRHEDGRLESEFSGNLVEVCPTGVFTDKTLGRHYTRKWDLQTAPSVCVHCGLGCNTIPGERYGLLRRIRARYNGAVNGYFLCDRGRYGYEFVNAPSRLRSITGAGGPAAEAPRPGPGAGPAATVAAAPPRAGAPLAGAALRAATGSAPPADLTLARPGPPSPSVPTLRGAEAAARVAGLIEEAQRAGRLVIGIGSPRATLEANFALKTLVGADSFFLGVPETESRLTRLIIDLLTQGPARSCSLRDLEQADAMLILGEGVTNTAPMLDYSLRQWLRRRPNEERVRLKIPEWNDAAVGEIVHEEPSALHIATVGPTKLDRIAAQYYHAAPDDLARLGFAVAHVLDPASPKVPGLAAHIREHANSIADAFRDAKRPIVVSGTSTGSEAIIKAAANVAWSLHQRGEAAELAFVVPECNSMGLALLGGRPLSEAFDALDEPGVDVAIILENDLYRRCRRDESDRLLQLARQVVVIDHTASETSRRADAVLPAATFAEATGTLVNNEGRAQRLYQVYLSGGDVRPSWHWLREILVALGRAEGEAWPDHDALQGALAQASPFFASLPDLARPASYRVAGMKIAREPHRFSGRTAILADRTVFEPPPPVDPDSPLAFSMEGFQGQPPAPLIPRFWAPGWNSGQALNKFQEEVRGPLSGRDPGVRLIEPLALERPPHFQEVPAAFEEVEDELTVVPVHHIFGSEELSMLAPGIAESAPQPYLGLSPADASRIGVDVGDEVVLEVADHERPVLPVAIVPSLPVKVPVLPVGLPGLEGLLPPFRVRIRPAGGPPRAAAALPRGRSLEPLAEEAPVPSLGRVRQPPPRRTEAAGSPPGVWPRPAAAAAEAPGAAPAAPPAATVAGPTEAPPWTAASPAATAPAPPESTSAPAAPEEESDGA